MESTAGCYPPDVIGGEICSGHGTCVCGACVCEDTQESRYSGKFCEKCPVSLVLINTVPSFHAGILDPLN